MSSSLVRQSLEIIEQDKNNDVKRGKKKKSCTSKGILHLIPSNHRLSTKKSKKELKITASHSQKTTIEEARVKLNTKSDQTENNIKRLLLLSGNRLDPKTSDKLLKRALKKRYVPEDIRPVEREETAFTEADFKQFEEEYHGE